jgi:hypothetical protein
MHERLFALTTWFQDHLWTVPLAGLAVAGLAFLAGRRLFIREAARDAFDPNGPSDANFLQGVLTDRRALPRRKGNLVEVEVLADVPGNPEPVEASGWVKDRAMGGLCLVVNRELLPGTVIKVRPRPTQTISPPWTPVTVRSCRGSNGEFELGCQFHHTPSWNVLLMFG